MAENKKRGHISSISDIDTSLDSSSCSTPLVETDKKNKCIKDYKSNGIIDHNILQRQAQVIAEINEGLREYRPKTVYLKDIIAVFQHVKKTERTVKENGALLKKNNCQYKKNQIANYSDSE